MLKFLFFVAMVATIGLASMWLSTFAPNNRFTGNKSVRQMVKKWFPYTAIAMLVFHFLQNELVIAAIMSLILIAMQFGFFWMMAVMPMFSFVQNHKAKHDKNFIKEAWNTFFLCCGTVTAVFIATGDFTVLFGQVMVHDFRFVVLCSVMAPPIVWGALKIAYNKHLEELKKARREEQKEEVSKALAAILAK